MGSIMTGLYAVRNSLIEKENIMPGKGVITVGTKFLIDKKKWDVVHKRSLGLR